jgi:hypothetical protein
LRPAHPTIKVMDPLLCIKAPALQSKTDHHCSAFDCAHTVPKNNTNLGCLKCVASCEHSSCAEIFSPIPLYACAGERSVHTSLLFARCVRAAAGRHDALYKSAYVPRVCRHSWCPYVGQAKHFSSRRDCLPFCHSCAWPWPKRRSTTRATATAGAAAGAAVKAEMSAAVPCAPPASLPAAHSSSNVSCM